MEKETILGVQFSIGIITFVHFTTFTYYDQIKMITNVEGLSFFASWPL